MVGTATASASATESTPPIPDQVVYDLSQAFKLLSDPLRLRLLFLMAQEGEINVGDLCDRVGQSQPAISHHLALLRVSGLVEADRRGKNNFYRVRTEHFADLLGMLLSASGVEPGKLKFHDFVLTYKG